MAVVRDNFGGAAQGREQLKPASNKSYSIRALSFELRFDMKS